MTNNSIHNADFFIKFPESCKKIESKCYKVSMSCLLLKTVVAKQHRGGGKLGANLGLIRVKITFSHLREVNFNIFF